MSVHAPDGWKVLFEAWPNEFPRRGILITAFGEQIAFANFLLSESFLLLERQAPDAMGGRTILLRYEKIEGLKLLDVVKPKTLQALGFDASGKER